LTAEFFNDHPAQTGPSADTRGSKPAPDFDRVGDLLGDACEAAASHGLPSSGSEEPHSRGRRSSTDEARPASSERSSERNRPVPPPSQDVARALAAVWPEVAGADVAANAQPVQLKGGRLTVSTSSSVWAQTLQCMSANLATRLNQRLGHGVISQIVFRHAGWEERSRTAPTTSAELSGPSAAGGPPSRQVTDRQGPDPAEGGRLSAEQRQALAEVEKLDLPPAIREKVVGAMRASFVRTQRPPVR
jgi:predicted nucleic acid-binding Zn ribbon protein